MAWLTSHVLDVALGRPGKGIEVHVLRDGQVLGGSETDADGRVKAWSGTAELERMVAGTYEVRFETGSYLSREHGMEVPFYPFAMVVFNVTQQQVDEKQHFHIPLLLSPYSYSTYRGS